jgi:hypothetical protein
MTRSGAPVQGASGDGKMVTSAEPAQLSDTAAGDTVADKSRRKNPPAIGKIAVAAKRCPRTIWM